MKTLANAVLAVALASLAGPARAEEARFGAPEVKGPRITVEPPSFDFGTVLPNKTVEREFLVRNFGTEDLVIAHVSTSCGCTVTQLDTKRLKPGAKTPLRVKLDTRTTLGSIMKSVFIRSNDPAKGTLELKLKATVVEK